jgi:hypothetical protein
MNFIGLSANSDLRQSWQIAVWIKIYKYYLDFAAEPPLTEHCRSFKIFEKFRTRINDNDVTLSFEACLVSLQTL